MINIKCCGTHICFERNKKRYVRLRALVNSQSAAHRHLFIYYEAFATTGSADIHATQIAIARTRPLASEPDVSNPLIVWFLTQTMADKKPVQRACTIPKYPPQIPQSCLHVSINPDNRANFRWSVSRIEQCSLARAEQSGIRHHAACTAKNTHTHETDECAAPMALRALIFIQR